MKRKRSVSDSGVRRSKRIQEIRDVRNSYSPLLSLPPELRNRIYEYVLTEDDCVQITPQLRFPSLVQTSRKLRSESRSMWFNLNTFRLTVQNHDAHLCHAWRTTIFPANLGCRLTIEILQSYNWTNLLEWCERAHSGPKATSIPLVDTSMGPALTFATTALEIARTHRGRGWGECLQALRNHRRGAAKRDPLWVIKG